MISDYLCLTGTIILCTILIFTSAVYPVEPWSIIGSGAGLGLLIFLVGAVLCVRRVT